MKRNVQNLLSFRVSTVVQLTVAILLGGLFPLQSAFAENGLEALRKGREHMGEKIYGLDNMISPSAPKAAKAIRAGSERTIGEVMFGNATIGQRMNIEMAKGLQAEKNEPEEELEPIRVDRAPYRRQEPIVEKMPVRIAAPPVVVAPVLPPSRLTDTMPAAPSPEYVPNGFWDELNNARERARRILADSWKAEDPRQEPVNYPGSVPGRRQLSPQLQSELAQANSFAPQQGALGSIGLPSAVAPTAVEEKPKGFTPYEKTAAADAIADEVREVEQEAGFIPGSGKSAGTERLLASIQTEDGVSDQPRGDQLSSDEVPMLRPKQLASDGIPMLRPRLIAGKRRRGPGTKQMASALARNTYARGSVNGETRENPAANYEVSRYRGLPDNFYRHLKPTAEAKPIYQDLPSMPRGQNVRTHNAGSPDYE